ncbi:hypothetical protein JHL18_24770 [Clostridium sp. YIM B02505]|uniref:Uncharacterized protein n=1 Tax=Clostridium yunnanense TaxID=2800325 RepID=A0ABS1EWT5_9CLOT|nr:CBO0543 family protein [Clostridium yunnanense]MBK1813837.1 hypothetical protein [Clostridium yunnanense]
MKIETMLLFAVPGVSIFSLLFVPKNKFFQAQFIFLFVQLLTWILGLSAVQLGFIEYPYRELHSVNRTSFLFEYLVLPIMCIHFNIFFPEASSKTIKYVYYFGITLIFTIIEYFAEKYTAILEYTGWKLYWTFISICIIFWISRVTTKWFFDKKI